MDNINMAANASAEDTAAVGAGDATSTTTEGNASAPQQDVTQTQSFARRLKEEVDRSIGGMGLTNHFTGQAIMTKADLAAYKRMQEAEAEGLDPESAAEAGALREELAGYRAKEQEAAIMGNPAYAPLYTEYRDTVHALIAEAAADGQDISLETALKAVIAENWDDISARQSERIRQEATKNFTNTALASPGAAGGAATGRTSSYATMSDADFDAALARAKRGELKGR